MSAASATSSCVSRAAEIESLLRT